MVATASAGGITDSDVLDVTGTSSFTDTADAGIILVTCSQTEQLPWMVERPRS